MDFVTRKISSGIARYASGYSKPLELGNLNAKRDWGFAGEFVKAMHLMLQQEKPDVFVISTNKTHSIRDFISFTCEAAEIDIVFEGEGLQERVIDKKSNKIIISVSDKYFRPADVELLIGDNSKAKSVLAWEPEVDVKELAKLMYYSDVEFLTKI
jgi:GDPmannose 4,6-dehydratase